METYCTIFRHSDNRIYQGPCINANSWREARRKALRLGVMVEGTYQGTISDNDDSNTVFYQQPHELVATGGRTRYAMDEANRASKFARYVPHLLRVCAGNLLIFADKIDKVRSRRGLIKIMY